MDSVTHFPVPPAKLAIEHAKLDKSNENPLRSGENEGSIIRTFQHEEVNEHDVMLYSTNAIETIEEAAK